MDIVPLGKRRDKLHLWLSGPPTPTRVWLATIKVLSVSKGRPVETFQLRYLTVDVHKLSGGIADPPIDIHLAKGKRYRFYLNSGEKYYTPCLQGEYDDGFSVVPLTRPWS